jgi:hypothetical protein
MRTEARVEGCREEVPAISMDPDAHYSIPRFWEKVALGRPLSDARIAAYIRAGRYGRTLRLPERFGGKLVWSA